MAAEIIRSVPDLTDHTQEELMELFKTLEAPTMDEMQGEFHSTKLGYHSLRDYIEWRVSCDNPLMGGDWVGKAWTKTSDTEGRGYNLFRLPGGRLKCKYPMYTCIAPSRYDGKPAFTLVYRAFLSGTAIVGMVDELRKVGDGTYLLIGTYGLTKKDKMRPHFWLIEGPYRSYRGDIGAKEPRKFDFRKEIPNYGK